MSRVGPQSHKKKYILKKIVCSHFTYRSTKSSMPRNQKQTPQICREYRSLITTDRDKAGGVIPYSLVHTACYIDRRYVTHCFYYLTIFHSTEFPIFTHPSFILYSHIICTMKLLCLKRQRRKECANETNPVVQRMETVDR